MKLFVWDFHGVLEKDNDLAVLDISNHALEEAGYKERFSLEDAQQYNGLKWYEYFERLLPHLSSEKHRELQAACFRYAADNLSVLEKHIKPNDHANEVLKKVHDAGQDQILVSNTRPSDLLWFISTVGLQSYLPETKVFGVNAHEEHGTKKDALAQYLKGKKFDAIIIIGDSQSDMILKDVAGGTTYFYSHPHLTIKRAVQADYIITDLRDVLAELR
jgi:phosphoglycolate phosphatase-like HAD superfamily hydrolase